MRQNNQYTMLYKERKNRFLEKQRYQIPESEAAVRKFQRKNKSLVLPILKHKNRALMAGFLIRGLFRTSRRAFGISRRVQKARLSARRQFLTSDDVKRAVESTSFALKRARESKRHGH